MLPAKWELHSIRGKYLGDVVYCENIFQILIFLLTNCSDNHIIISKVDYSFIVKPFKFSRNAPLNLKICDASCRNYLGKYENFCLDTNKYNVI